MATAADADATQPHGDPSTAIPVSENSEQQPQQIFSFLRSTSLETPATVRATKLNHLTERLNAVCEAARQLSSDAKAQEAFRVFSEFYTADLGGDGITAEALGLDGSVQKLPTTQVIRSLLLRRKRDTVYSTALEHYGAVQTHLTGLHQQVRELRVDVAESLDALSKCKERCADVIAAAQALRTSRQTLQAKKLVACQMIELLHVPESVVTVLAGNMPTQAGGTSTEDPGQHALNTLVNRLLPAFEELVRIEANARELKALIRKVTGRDRNDTSANSETGDDSTGENASPSTRPMAATDSTSGASTAEEPKHLQHQLALSEIASALSSVAADESLARVEDLRVIGFERLAAAVQRIVRHAKDFGENGVLGMSAGAAISQSLKLLEANPKLGQSVITDCLKSRRAQITQKFERCLIVGVPAATGGYSVQLSTLELPRYVGDMLGFVHELTPLVLEFVREILRLPLETEKDGSPTVREAFDFVFGAVIDEIEERITDALAASDSFPPLLCRAEHVILFYANAFQSLAPEGVRITKLCKTHREKTHELFLDAWEKQTMKLSTIADDELRGDDLGTPPYLIRHLGSLAEVLAVYEGAEQLNGPAGTSEQDRILSSAVTPLLNVCRQIARTLSPTKAGIYLVNCYQYIITTLAAFPSAAEYHSLCQSLLDEQTVIMHTLMAETALQNSGLKERLEALQHWETQPSEVKERLPVSSVSTLHPLSMSACLGVFYQKLFLPAGITPPEIEKISSRAIRNATKLFVLNKVVETYAELYDRVVPVGIAAHSPAEIRELLGL